MRHLRSLTEIQSATECAAPGRLILQSIGYSRYRDTYKFLYFTTQKLLKTPRQPTTGFAFHLETSEPRDSAGFQQNCRPFKYLVERDLGAYAHTGLEVSTTFNCQLFGQCNSGPAKSPVLRALADTPSSPIPSNLTEFQTLALANIHPSSEENDICVGQLTGLSTSRHHASSFDDLKQIRVESLINPHAKESRKGHILVRRVKCFKLANAIRALEISAFTSSVTLKSERIRIPRCAKCSKTSSTSPWIVSAVLSGRMSASTILHFVGTKMPTNGRYNFGQFIQKHISLLLFEDENDVVRIEKVFVTGYLNTGVLEIFQYSSHEPIDHQIK
ncbi:hypothetical protein T265_01810 [Opisthorchis viverrini]|uniref:Uncharacterized protein n=1 Tax=Opisthorchis viverrini TaxID=6198 RepID=A0A074ZY72_OPIVI|nr:hypothetical protein T265_01810 [Opisthorchis viverrini]KER32031.1 hypothetical protein T265_01810 [Opisthorchis viverrini]